MGSEMSRHFKEYFCAGLSEGHHCTNLAYINAGDSCLVLRML